MKPLKIIAPIIIVIGGIGLFIAHGGLSSLSWSILPPLMIIAGGGLMIYGKIARIRDESNQP